MEQGYWMRLLVCFLLISGALCAALPADYVQYLLNVAREGNLENVETPDEYAFFRITRSEMSRPIAGPADLPMLRFG